MFSCISKRLAGAGPTYSVPVSSRSLIAVAVVMTLISSQCLAAQTNQILKADRNDRSNKPIVVAQPAAAPVVVPAAAAVDPPPASDLSTGLISTGLIASDPDSSAAAAADAAVDAEEAKNTNYSEPRFAMLFNRANRRPRPLVARHVAKPKPTLPSFIRNTPAIQAVTFAPTQRPDRIVTARTSRPTSSPSRTTAAPRSARGSRTTTTTTTPSPSLSASARRSRVREQLAASGVIPTPDPRRRRFGSDFTKPTSTERPRGIGRN